MWNVNYCVALTGQRSSIICAYNTVEKMEAEQKSNVYNSTTSVHQLIGMCQQKALFAKKKDQIHAFVKERWIWIIRNSSHR